MDKGNVNKPIPTPTAETQRYWQAAANGQLMVQICNDCQTLQSLPRPLCGACQSDSLSWRQANGRGTVISYSWVERGPTKAFASPYMLALIELEDGVRLMLNIIGDNAKQARIGDAVDIIFEARGDEGFQLPQATLAR